MRYSTCLKGETDAGPSDHGGACRSGPRVLEGEDRSRLQDPRARFRMLVAMNTSSILERELVLGKDPAPPESLEDPKARVTKLDREMAGSICHGAVPEGAVRLVKNRPLPTNSRWRRSPAIRSAVGDGATRRYGPWRR